MSGESGMERMQSRAQFLHGSLAQPVKPQPCCQWRDTKKTQLMSKKQKKNGVHLWAKYDQLGDFSTPEK